MALGAHCKPKRSTSCFFEHIKQKASRSHTRAGKVSLKCTRMKKKVWWFSESVPEYAKV